MHVKVCIKGKFGGIIYSLEAKKMEEGIVDRVRTKCKRANEQLEQMLPSIEPERQLHILNIYQFS
jgi:hypothetical protein